jgi:hypothetical protein
MVMKSSPLDKYVEEYKKELDPAKRTKRVVLLLRELADALEETRVGFTEVELKFNNKVDEFPNADLTMNLVDLQR